MRPKPQKKILSIGIEPEFYEKISHGNFFDGKLRNFSSSKAPFLRNFSIFHVKIMENL